MGASFQAPCAAPRQRQMEMHHVELIVLCVFQNASMTDHTGMYKMNAIRNNNNYNNNSDNEWQ